MKRIFLFICVCALLFAGCKTQTLYVPVESVKTEYRDNFLRDSIYVQDSVFVRIKGDTVLIEKYKYLYRDKLVRDSVVINDTVRVPYPVEVEKKVNHVSGWQNFQIWCGRGLLVILGIYFAVRYFRKGS